MFRVTRTAHGPKVYLAGLRVHHGLAGLALAAAGVALVIDDWADRWWSVFDRDTWEQQ